MPDFLDTGDPELCRIRSGGVFPDADVSGFPAKIRSGIAHPSGSGEITSSEEITSSGGIAGSGGLGLYKDGSWERVAISKSTGDWVTSLCARCLSCDWVVGASSCIL